jgi:hypothetical protein
MKIEDCIDENGMQMDDLCTWRSAKFERVTSSVQAMVLVVNRPFDRSTTAAA